jgi:hypothetical protein
VATSNANPSLRRGRVSTADSSSGGAGRRGYNAAVTPRTVRAVLALLLAGHAFLAVGPFHLGAVRVGGVSLLWWYGGAVAPLLAAAVALLMPRGGAARSSPQARRHGSAGCNAQFEPSGAGGSPPRGEARVDRGEPPIRDERSAVAGDEGARATSRAARRPDARRAAR